MYSIGNATMWSLFVVCALLGDFFAMNKQGAHKVSLREAGIWSLIWVAVSFVFVAWMWWYLGTAYPFAAKKPVQQRARQRAE